MNFCEGRVREIRGVPHVRNAWTVQFLYRLCVIVHVNCKLPFQGIKLIPTVKVQSSSSMRPSSKLVAVVPIKVMVIVEYRGL